MTGNLRISVVTRIGVPPERVWQSLVDFDRYEQWHPALAVDSAPARLAVGARITGRATAGPGAPQRVTLTLAEVEPPHRLAWLGGDPDELLGEHGFHLTADAGQDTELTEYEEFSGPAADALRPSAAALEGAYRSYGRALKQWVEGRTRT